MLEVVMDLMRCGHAVNRWIPLMVMEFLLYDVATILPVVGSILEKKKVDSDHVRVR